MKLTLSVGYGIGVLLQIQAQARDGPVTAARIARGCHFPPRFLYRVLRKLVDAGLLRGTSGPGGGYSLAKQPREITVLDIVRGVENSPEPTVLVSPCSAHRKAISRVNKLCRQNAEWFTDELGGLSLADLIRMDSRRGGPPRSKLRPR